MKKFAKILQKFFGLGFLLTAIYFLIIYQTRFFEIEIPKIAVGVFFVVLFVGTYLWQKNLFSVNFGFFLETGLSYFLAYIFCFYALGKIFNLQFLVEPMILEQKVGEIDGFWKAWVFFGHSYQYGLFLAGAEILAAFLLLWRKTRTVGALIFCGVMLNIVMIDFIYGVEAMKYSALLFLLMGIYLLIDDSQRIMAFVLNRNFSSDISSAIILNSKEKTILAVSFSGLLLMILRDVKFFYEVGRNMS